MEIMKESQEKNWRISTEQYFQKEFDGLLLQPLLNDQKLTLLPVRKLMDIMTTVHILEKEKDASE